MDAPSTGWVTALAGLLARGSSPSCARPSRFPSGHTDAGSPLSVAGAATDFCKFAKGLTKNETADSPCSLFRPRSDPGNQHLKMFPLTRWRVKRCCGRRPNGGAVKLLC